MINSLNDISWVLALRTEDLTYFFSIFPFFVNAGFIFGFIALLYWNSLNRDCFGLIFTSCFSFAYSNILKLLFAQSRPPLEYQMVPVDWQMGMPSGDVLFIAFFWLAITRIISSQKLAITSIILIALVMCSRVYLGVHTPLQVLAGLFFGLLLYFIHFLPAIQNLYNRWFIRQKLISYWVILTMVFAGLIYLFPPAAELKTTLIIAGVLMGTGISAMFGEVYIAKENINLVRTIFGLVISLVILWTFSNVPIYEVTITTATLNLTTVMLYITLIINMLWLTPKICK